MANPFLQRARGPADIAGITVRFYATSATRPLTGASGWGGFAQTVVLPPGDRATVTAAFQAAVERILGKPARNALITLGQPFGSGSELSQPVELKVSVVGLDDPRSLSTDIVPVSATQMLDAVLRAYAEVFAPTNRDLSIDNLRAAVAVRRRVGAYSADAAPAYTYNGAAAVAGQSSASTADAQQKRRAARDLNEWLRNHTSEVYDSNHRSRVVPRIREGQIAMGMTGNRADGKYGVDTRNVMAALLPPGETPWIDVRRAPPAGGGGTGGGLGGGTGGGVPQYVVDPSEAAPLAQALPGAEEVRAALQVIDQRVSSQNTMTLVAVGVGVLLVGGAIWYSTTTSGRAQIQRGAARVKTLAGRTKRAAG
jgi:hypothetical protein